MAVLSSMKTPIKAPIKARQIKAGRALLDWSQDKLAELTGLSIATIRKLELGYISPREATMDAIRRVFEAAGLEFLEPNGVRQRPEEILIYEGRQGLHDFFDDIYRAANLPGSDIILVCPNAQIFIDEVMGDYSATHMERMTAIKDRITNKCLVMERSPLPASAYCEYRWLSKQYVDSVSFYVYGDKYAIIRSKNKYSASKIIVIQSKDVADAFRQQFYSMWEKATPLNALKRLGARSDDEKSRTAKSRGKA